MDALQWVGLVTIYTCLVVHCTANCNFFASSCTTFQIPCNISTSRDLEISVSSGWKLRFVHLKKQKKLLLNFSTANKTNPNESEPLLFQCIDAEVVFLSVRVGWVC